MADHAAASTSSSSSSPFSTAAVPRLLLSAFSAASLLPGGAVALDNGLGRTPAMGYSSWNDCSSMRDNGPDGWCWNTEEHIKNTTLYFISSGLADLGYIQMNIDEGWFKNRSSTGEMVEDFEKFPSGMKALGSWIKNQTARKTKRSMRYGLYTSRGTVQCGTGTYHATGSHGHEAQDVNWMVEAGADYLKVDSCGGSQDHATAFSDYSKFRDAMNATGTPVYFSLCGWHDWYAPPDPALSYKGGSSLGNSWRIAGDGSNWDHLTNCVNVMAEVASYAGPGGWNDPDLLIGPEVYVGGQTDEQARAQFTLWSLFPTNLLISQNVLQWSDYALETYSNEELIAINQDLIGTVGTVAQRIQGSDLAFPCDHAASTGIPVVAVACNPNDKMQQWTVHQDGTIESVGVPGQVLDDFHCSTSDKSPVYAFPRDGSGGQCGGLNQKWGVMANGSIVNKYSSKCLDVLNWTGPTVDTYACHPAGNQNFQHQSWGGLKSTAQEGHEALCVAVSATESACQNIWGRTLANSDVALAFVNNADHAVNITCGADCFAKLNLSSTTTTLYVRDLWQHKQVGTIHSPFSFTSSVGANGSATAYRLSQKQAEA